MSFNSRYLLVDANLRQAALNFWRISLIDGFKWFTRIDFQNTELDPEWPALRMLEAANNQEILGQGLDPLSRLHRTGFGDGANQWLHLVLG